MIVFSFVTITSFFVVFSCFVSVCARILFCGGPSRTPQILENTHFETLTILDADMMEADICKHDLHLYLTQELLHPKSSSIVFPLFLSRQNADVSLSLNTEQAPSFNYDRRRKWKRDY